MFLISMWNKLRHFHLLSLTYRRSYFWCVVFVHIDRVYSIVIWSSFCRLWRVSEKMWCSSFSVWLISLSLTSCIPCVFCKWHNFIFLGLNTYHVLFFQFICILVNILVNTLSWPLLVLTKNIGMKIISDIIISLVI